MARWRRVIEWRVWIRVITSRNCATVSAECCFVSPLQPRLHYIVTRTQLHRLLLMDHDSLIYFFVFSLCLHQMKNTPSLLSLPPFVPCFRNVKWYGFHFLCVVISRSALKHNMRVSRFGSTRLIRAVQSQLIPPSIPCPPLSLRYISCPVFPLSGSVPRACACCVIYPRYTIVLSDVWRPDAHAH